MKRATFEGPLPYLVIGRSNTSTSVQLRSWWSSQLLRDQKVCFNSITWSSLRCTYTIRMEIRSAEVVPRHYTWLCVTRCRSTLPATSPQGTGFLWGQHGPLVSKKLPLPQKQKGRNYKNQPLFLVERYLGFNKTFSFLYVQKYWADTTTIGGRGGGKRVTELGLASVNPLGDPAGGLAINALSIPHNKMQYVADPIFTPGPVRKVKECAVMRYHELWCCHKCGLR